MVYVDHMKAQYGRMVMCHMIADTRKELLGMVDKIGVDRKWIQNSGTAREHFDISLGKRKLALFNGAREISVRGLVEMLRSRERIGSPA